MTQKVYVIVEKVLDWSDRYTYTNIIAVYATRQLADENRPVDDSTGDTEGYFYSIEEKEFIGGEVVIY